jgi:hypothetical protein
MNHDEKVARLVEQLKMLKQQQKLLEQQVAALAEKLPPDSEERKNFEQLPLQMAKAIEKAAKELKALNISPSELE